VAEAAERYIDDGELLAAAPSEAIDPLGRILKTDVAWAGGQFISMLNRGHNANRRGVRVRGSLGAAAWPAVSKFPGTSVLVEQVAIDEVERDE